MKKANSYQSGNNQSGSSEVLLDLSLKILEKAYSRAKKVDDTETMLAISDRLMILYGMIEEVKTGNKGKPLGFVDIEGNTERG